MPTVVFKLFAGQGTRQPENGADYYASPFGEHKNCFMSNSKKTQMQILMPITVTLIMFLWPISLKSSILEQHNNLTTEVEMIVVYAYLCLLKKWKVLSVGKFFLLSVSAWNETLPIGERGNDGPFCKKNIQGCNDQLDW